MRQNLLFEDKKLSGAVFSDDRLYRYKLWRIWDKSKPLVMFIGLNPSTANEDENDPTIRSVERISKFNGYGGFYMMNCFPLVSTDPAYLHAFLDTPFHDIEDMENMRHLLEVSKICSDVIFAWGNFKVAIERGKSLSGYFKTAKVLQTNKNGSPKHPLYCKSNSKLVNFA